ncbi:MAG: PTPA-CTERM sorting domain-containing protein [Leptolyngbyaceae cyanobacterium SM2_5_2]|nr:PTPA-CTERM sorting domain-containing protein [Leptolyngbyaceae cyanobacterium SM2_5_2]
MEVKETAKKQKVEEKPLPSCNRVIIPDPERRPIFVIPNPPKPCQPYMPTIQYFSTLTEVFNDVDFDQSIAFQEVDSQTAFESNLGYLALPSYADSDNLNPDNLGTLWGELEEIDLSRASDEPGEELLSEPLTSPAQVPTPALLSGLVGLCLAALHRRVQAADDQ